MGKRLTLEWIVIGLGISALAFSSPVISLEEWQPHGVPFAPHPFAPHLAVASIYLPQAAPMPQADLGQERPIRWAWGISGDLFLTGCATASLLFACKFRRRLLSEQDSATSR